MEVDCSQTFALEKKKKSSTQLKQLDSRSEEDGVAPEEPPKQSATSEDIQRSLVQSQNALDFNHDISQIVKMTKIMKIVMQVIQIGRYGVGT